MRLKRFFTLVWRVNGILIFLTSLLAVFILTAAAYAVIGDMMRTRHVNNLANVATRDVKGEIRTIGEFQEIVGSPVRRAELNVQQKYNFDLSSKEAGSIRNYLYFNTETKQSYWLLPNDDSMIIKSIPLPDDRYRSESRHAVVYVHVLVAKDTSGDQRLSIDDMKQIAVSDPDGKRFRIVASANELNDSVLLPQNRLLLLYSTKGETVATEVDLNDPAAKPVSTKVAVTRR